MATLTGEALTEFLREGARTLKVATVRRNGGPHVAPVWFELDGEALVFTTGRDSAKGKNLRRDPRVWLCVENESPPQGFVLMEGTAEISEDRADLAAWATRIAERYVGPERAERVGRRSSGEDSILVRVTPTKTLSRDRIIR